MTIFHFGTIIIFLFSIYFISISWIVFLRGDKKRDNTLLSLLINTVQLLGIFTIVSIFPFNNLFYFTTLILVMNFISFFIYSFPHSTPIKPSWTIYFMAASLTLLSLFLFAPEVYLPWIHLAPIPLFIFPQIFIITKKRHYIAKHLKLQTTLFLSMLIVLSLINIIKDSLSLFSYNISFARYTLFLIPILEIIILIIVRNKTIFSSTGLSASRITLAAILVVPFTLLTIAFRPISLFIHSLFPLSLTTPITAATTYILFNIIAFGAAISTLFLDTLLHEKRNRFASTTQKLQLSVEKTTNSQDLHNLFRSTLFQTFPPLNTVQLLLLKESAIEEDFPLHHTVALTAAEALSFCKKEITYAIRNNPNTHAQLNTILHTHDATALFPFKQQGIIAGFYLIDAQKLTEIDFNYITFLITIISSRHTHITLFNQLIEQQQKLQNRRYLYETGKMLSVIAHELRTPLSSIMFNLDVILEEMKSNTFSDPEYLEIARKELQRLNDTIEKMLTYGRVTTLEARDGTFKEFVESITALLNFQDIDFEVKFLSRLDNYAIDWDRLKTVVFNLLTNSQQAVQESDNKRITLTIQEKRSLIHIHILNTGPPIPLDKQNEIFTPFVSTKKEGNGLGLAICKKITKLMGGGIRLQISREGLTDFHFWIQKNQQTIEGEEYAMD